MRKPLRQLTITTLTITALTLPAAAAWADGDINYRGTGGSSGTVTVKASSPGKAAAPKQSAPKTTNVSAKKTTDVTPKKTTNVSAKQTTRVDNYSSGKPTSQAVADPNPNPWTSIGGTDLNVRDGNPLVLGAARIGLGVAKATGDAQGAGRALGTIAGNAVEFSRDRSPTAQPAAPAQPAPADPAAPAEPVVTVDPAVLAQQAVSSMGLEAPEIASTPNNPDTLGAVGLPVWFWASNPGPTTTGPQEATASAGPVTVTANARFTGMTIQTGDGTTVECDGPGTEYPGVGVEPSPDCGHVYEQMSDDQPDGLYAAEITAHWTVDWTATTGESGTIPVDLETSKQLRIGQYQTVVTDVH